MYNWVMLRVEKLSITYKSTGQKVLNGLSFQVKKGETVAILGPSGCGKTTLLNYLQGLLSEKEVKVSGELILDKKAVIRTVFQEPRLLPWFDAVENVVFGLEAVGESPEEASKKAMKILKLIGLEKYAHYYPNQLSIGMQQRINLGRALVCKPDLLLMDEPFSGLDGQTKQNILIDFHRISRKTKTTVVFVTHYIEEANFLADRLLRLSTKGKLTSWGKRNNFTLELA